MRMYVKRKRFYKKGDAVYKVAHTEEWQGHALKVCHVARDSQYRPFGVEAIIQGDFEEATAADWEEAMTKAVKCQAKLDKAQREREEAEKFGVRVKRTQRNGRETVEAPDDFIVRATKAQWIGIKGRYRRVGEWKRGEQTRRGYKYAPIVSITEESLDELDRLAAGRERVNFVKERKQVTK